MKYQARVHRDTVNIALRKLGDPTRVMHAAGVALYAEGERIMNEAKSLTPVDEGVLRASAMVGTPEISGLGVSVTLGFGGAAQDYAVVQHERLDYAHTVGQAKYLEEPALAAKTGFSARVGAAMAALLK